MLSFTSRPLYPPVLNYLRGTGFMVRAWRRGEAKRVLSATKQSVTFLRLSRSLATMLTELRRFRVVEEVSIYNSLRKTGRVTHRSNSKSKRTAIPVQAWAGPEGSKSLRLTDFETVGM